MRDKPISDGCGGPWDGWSRWESRWRSRSSLHRSLDQDKEQQGRTLLAKEENPKPKNLVSSVFLSFKMDRK